MSDDYSTLSIFKSYIQMDNTKSKVFSFNNDKVARKDDIFF
jgi:hypothetical protein